jgi:glucokinase
MQIKKDKCIVVLDVGGTSLKSTLVNLAHLDSLISKECFRKRLINSQGSAETIIKTFTQAIKAAFEKALLLKLKVMGIGVSMPGPFNYEEGISLMKHKFKAIYGVNLKKEFTMRLNLKENFPIKFVGDPLAFLIGEAYFGAARDFTRVIGITLGAGIGSAFMVNKQIVKQGKGIPPEGAIWSLPYRGGIVEDRVSRQAILNKYKTLSGTWSKDLDVDKISLLALKGDKISLQVFEELGVTFGKILKPIASEFRADCIVFGGGISQTFSLFARSLEKELQVMPDLKKVVPTKLGDLSAFYGVAKEFITD